MAAGAKDYRGDLVLTMDTGDGVFGYSAAKPYTYQSRKANTKLYLRYCAYHHAKSGRPPRIVVSPSI